MAEAARDDQPLLRILVVRSGGFAGIRQQWHVEADDDADGWVELVAACPWGAVVVDLSSADRFSWRIEVSQARARRPRSVQVATVPDSGLTGPWRTLVDRVRESGSRG